MVIKMVVTISWAPHCTISGRKGKAPRAVGTTVQHSIYVAILIGRRQRHMAFPLAVHCRVEQCAFSSNTCLCVVDVRVFQSPLDTDVNGQRLAGGLHPFRDLSRDPIALGRIGGGRPSQDRAQPATVEIDVSVLRLLGTEHATVKYG